MSKVALRVYIRNIDDLIAQEAYQKAFLQARHVLYHFPKYLEAYRVLGKAFLEARQYSNALDIFLRLLSAVPDDFLAHVALSIIREEEGNLDAALWHMERAFEVQPSNLLVQEELQRLYREKEGVAPPRIRLTRAALARIYARSGFYPQAIVELESLLREHPNRYDLMGILCEVYEGSGQERKAMEVAARLLRLLPYHWKANWVMARILERQGKKDEAQRYWDRIVEMDPYAAHLSEEWPTPDDVPDDMVTLPELEVEMEEWEEELPVLGEGIGQDLFSLEAESSLLSALPGGTESSSEEASPEEPLLPPWFQKAEADSTPSQEPAEEKVQEEPVPDLEPGEIPEWLQEMAQVSASPAESEGEEETPEWLDELLSSETTPTSLEEPLLTEEEPQPSTQEMEREEEVPPETEAWSPEETLPWSQQEAPEAALGEEAKESEIAFPWDQPEETTPQSEEAAPPLSAALESKEEEDLPPWLREEAASLAEEPETEAKPTMMEEEELPSWLQETFADEAPTEEAPSFIQEADEETDLTPWLEEMSEEEALESTSPLQTSEPEAEAQVTEAAFPSTEEETQAVHQELEKEMPEAEDASKDLQAILEDEDAALAWLEQLAAQQGVPEEELITRPEERPSLTEEAEPVVQSEADLGEAPAMDVPEPPEAQVPMEETGEAVLAPGEGQEPLDHRLEALTFEASSEAVEAPLGTEETVGWPTFDELEEIPAEVEPTPQAPEFAETTLQEKEPPESAQEAPSEIPKEVLEDEEAALAWLEELASRQGVPEEELITRPEERPSLTPAPTSEKPSPAVAEEEILPMDEATAPEPRVEEGKGVPQEAGLPSESTETLVPEAEPAVSEAPVEEPETMEEVAQEPPSPEEDIPEWLRLIEEEEEEAVVSETEIPEWEYVEDLEEKPRPTQREEEPIREATVETPQPAQDIPTEEVEPETAAVQEALGEEGVPVGEAVQEPSPEATDETAPLDPEVLENWLAQLARERTRADEEAGEEETLQEVLEPVMEAPSVESAAPEQAKVVPVATAPATPEEGMLAEARAALEKKDLEQALRLYGKLIRSRKGKPYLSDIIEDLYRAQYEFPMSVDLLILLGDAYAKAGRLQEAMNAYWKAEQLVR